MKRTPFDPVDPFDAMCENFRRQVVQMVLDAEGITLYRELGARQLEAFVAGTLTGLVGVGMASIKPEGHKEFLRSIRGYLRHARFQTESILGNDEQLNTCQRPEDQR